MHPESFILNSDCLEFSTFYLGVSFIALNDFVHIALAVLSCMTLTNSDSDRLPNNALKPLALVSYDFFYARFVGTVVGYWYPPSKISQTSALRD